MTKNIRTNYVGKNADYWKSVISPIVREINGLQKEENKLDDKLEGYIARNLSRVGISITNAEYYEKMEEIENKSLQINTKKHELLREYNKLVREMNNVAFREKMDAL